LVGTAVLLVGGQAWPILGSLLLLILPASMLSLITLRRTEQSLAHLPRLGFVYAVYGVARAISLFRVRHWFDG